MRTTDSGWFQVVIDPGLENVDMVTEQVEALVEGDEGHLLMTPWLEFKLMASRRLHPLVHHYVPMKRFDEGSQRLINTPYVTCIWCPRTRRG